MHSPRRISVTTVAIFVQRAAYAAAVSIHKRAAPCAIDLACRCENDSQSALQRRARVLEAMPAMAAMRLAQQCALRSGVHGSTQSAVAHNQQRTISRSGFCLLNMPHVLLMR